MAPFLSKPGRLVPIPAAANQSRHSGGATSWAGGLEPAIAQGPARAGSPVRLCQPLSLGPGEVGRQESGCHAWEPKPEACLGERVLTPPIRPKWPVKTFQVPSPPHFVLILLRSLFRP